ncbi:MAG: MarR family winged helix-turn-helix transcriptional regulator [Asticcacaulis sp.]
MSVRQTPPEPELLSENLNDSDIGLGRLSGFIGFRFRRIQNYLSRQFAGLTQEYGLRSGALSSLAIIEENPGISQAVLAKAIGMDATAAVALLEELGRKGWIERRRTEQDRRRYAIFLSDKGQAVLNHLLEVLSGTEDEALRVLSVHELLVLNRALEKIYDHCFHGDSADG